MKIFLAILLIIYMTIFFAIQPELCIAFKEMDPNWSQFNKIAGFFVCDRQVGIIFMFSSVLFFLGYKLTTPKLINIVCIILIFVAISLIIGFFWFASSLTLSHSV
jgi:hypothetical protein